MRLSSLPMRRLFLFLVSNAALFRHRVQGWCAFTVNGSSGERFPNTFLVQEGFSNQEQALMPLLHHHCALVMSSLACVDPVCAKVSAGEPRCQLPKGAKEAYFCQFGELRFIWDEKDSTPAHQCAMKVLAQVQCDGVDEQIGADVVQSLVFLLTLCAVIGGGYAGWRCWRQLRDARLNHCAQRQRFQFDADVAFRGGYGAVSEETVPEIQSVEISRC